MEAIEAATTMEQVLITKARQAHSPINGSIELLPLCNLDCDMCYVKLTKEKQEAISRLRSVEEWIALGKEMVQNGVLFLLLTGGEPLLYPEFKKLYIELIKMGFIITINTNGTLIDEEWADFFEKNKPRRINVTLYGSDDETYESLCHYKNGFSKAIAGIKLLRKRNVDVKIGTSLTRKNYKDLEKMIALAKAMDVPFVADAYMMSATRERQKEYNYDIRLEPEVAGAYQIKSMAMEFEEDRFNEFVKRTLTEIEDAKRGESIGDSTPRSLDCLAGSCSFAISWQGDLKPCVVLKEPFEKVFEVGFKTAWDGVQKEVSKIRLNHKCTICQLRSVCRTCGGCALIEGGSFDAIPEYMCRFAEGEYKELIEYGKKIKDE